MRTDPDRARELLLEFADFTRYSFRRHGEYTTLAEEPELHRALPAAGAGPLRRPAAGDAQRGTGGAARRRTVPVRPAARRERRPARPGERRPDRPADDQRPRPRARGGDRGRGQRGRRGPGQGTTCARRRHRVSTRSASATWTHGCARPSATTTVSSWRRRRVRARR
nr:histidine kinase [Nocardioides convexus]